MFYFVGVFAVPYPLNYIPFALAVAVKSLPCFLLVHSARYLAVFPVACVRAEPIIRFGEGIAETLIPLFSYLLTGKTVDPRNDPQAWILFFLCDNPLLFTAIAMVFTIFQDALPSYIGSLLVKRSRNVRLFLTRLNGGGQL